MPTFVSLRVFVLVALFAAAAVGCAQHQPLPQVELGGSSWQLDMMGEQPALPPRPMLAFDGAGNVAGKASCNRYSAPVTITGDAITFGPIAATRMACGDAIDAREAAYFARLGTATRFDVSGSILRIYSGDDSAPLLFLRVSAP
jgi:heat shock protein HslJ